MPQPVKIVPLEPEKIRDKIKWDIPETIVPANRLAAQRNGHQCIRKIGTKSGNPIETMNVNKALIDKYFQF